MKHAKRKVAVCGAVNIDTGGEASVLTPGDSVPGRVHSSLGGVGWNIARDCALLGADTSFVSVLGADVHARAIRDDARRRQVRLRHCRWVREDNNRYLYLRGGDGEIAAAVNDMRLCERIDEAFIRARLPMLSRQDAVAAEANLPPAALRALAEETRVPLVADCVSVAKCEKLRALLPRLHTVKANLMEAAALTGQSAPADCARALLAAGVRRAVISLGSGGALFAEEGRVLRLPASDAPVIDATGAGDSLTAALTVGLARGLPLEECAALGMRAAALTMGERGAVTSALRQLA